MKSTVCFLMILMSSVPGLYANDGISFTQEEWGVIVGSLVAGGCLCAGAMILSYRRCCNRPPAEAAPVLPPQESVEVSGLDASQEPKNYLLL